MKVLLKEPGIKPRIVETDGSLSSLQDLVGGPIEHVGMRKGLGMLCNENGKLEGLKENFYMAAINDVIVGNAVFIGEDGEDFTDINKADADLITTFMFYLANLRKRPEVNQ